MSQFFLKTLFLGFAFLCVQSAYSQVSYKSCNPSEKLSVEAAHYDLSKRLEELTDERTGISLYTTPWVLRNFVAPNNRRSNSQYRNANLAYHNFQTKLKEGLNQMMTKIKKGFTYKCLSSSSMRCKSGDVYAYVMRLGNIPFNKIYLCPAFFQEDGEEQRRTLLHELSHLASNTDHYVGDTFSDEGLLKEANNAYYFEKMMDNELEFLLKRNAWVFLWKRTSND